MLSGQAKEDFEKWLGEKNFDEWKSVLDLQGLISYPDSMQWGIIEDWFDSAGLLISIIPPMVYGKASFHYFINDKTNGIENLRTRQEARNAAIEKAVLIYNANKLK